MRVGVHALFGAVAGAAEPEIHRYWRIVSLAIPGGSFFEVSEIGLYTDGVRNTGATMASSDAPIAGSLADLDDANTSTRCYWSEATAEGGGFYISWDFGTDTEINGFAQAGFDNSARYMQALTLQWSDDNSAWTTKATLSGLSYPGNNTMSSVIPV